ncbi:hydroxymethylbilane synthase [Rhodotorula paludigena]|uniref:hydroxymethylbilane synthase n=1 Tax=Rhodotorula paludigena TaxID=86838 RepID=UPI00316FFE89
MISSLPPNHPPIPSTSTNFPTRPPPSCPMSQLAATRPGSPSATHPYAGQTFTLGTRNSKLAMVQTEIVRRELEQRWPGCEIRIFGMTTLGDNVQTQPLYTFGGKALWTKELEVALLCGQVDAIVHSLKDVPTEFPPGCELGAVLEREDPSDALVVKEGLPYTSLDEMPEGSVIGTSSVRRVAQLRRKYPGLKFADVRGNLGTRLKKLDDPTSSYTALILASAGLLRLNLGHRITSSVSSPALYHAVGQGAIGVEIREGDQRARDVIGSLECWKTSWRTRAERMMLRVLEGGCSVPVGCETKLTEVFVKGGEGDAPLSPRAQKKLDLHFVRVERDPNAPRVPVSPEQVNDLPLPLSPRSAALGLAPASPQQQPGVVPPTAHVTANGSSAPKQYSAESLGLLDIAEPDDTTGIPAGHPAVNPSHVCPITGRMLPVAPLVSPSRRAVALPGGSEHASSSNGSGTIHIPPLHECAHRPGRTPSCPGSDNLTHHATLSLTGTITSLSGTHAVLYTLSRRCHSPEDCEQLGADVARELIEGGGKEILTELGRHVKEVGGGDEQHDGKEIPVEAPGASSPPAVCPIGIPAASAAAAANGHAGGVAKSPVASKSPQSHRTVFREGEVCLRPVGW